jgi:5-methylcytosine-specific restriction endonuclease McrA
MWRWIKKKLRRWSYRRMLHDPRWLQLRLKIIQMDRSRCILCGSQERLEVHHLLYRPNCKPWQYQDEDLVTLCRKCHAHAHGRER